MMVISSALYSFMEEVAQLSKPSMSLAKKNTREVIGFTSSQHHVKFFGIIVQCKEGDKWQAYNS